MTDIYVPSGNPPASGPLLSADIRAEFAAIAAALNSAFPSGSWTPQITFGTPGDLSVSYSVQAGTYQRLKDLVVLGFRITTSAFTWSTSSGNLIISGIPILSSASNVASGALVWGGINKAGYTDLTLQIGTSASQATVLASAMGQAAAIIQAADVPSGGTVVLRGNICYFAN